MFYLSLLQLLEARQVREKYDLESTYQHSRLSTNDTRTSARLADQSETAAVRPVTTLLIMRAASLLCAPPHYYARCFIMRAGSLYTPVIARGSSAESVHIWTSIYTLPFCKLLFLSLRTTDERQLPRNTCRCATFKVDITCLVLTFKPHGRIQEVLQLLRQLARDVDYMQLLYYGKQGHTEHRTQTRQRCCQLNGRPSGKRYLAPIYIDVLLRQHRLRVSETSTHCASLAVTTIRIDRPSTGSPEEW